MPALIRFAKTMDGRAIGVEEEVVVIHAAGVLELLSQSQLTLKDRASSGTELDAAILAGLRPIAINPRDTRLRHAQRPVRRIEIRNHEGELFRRAQALEETEFIVVALRFTPVVMDRRDEDFGVLNAEGVDRRSILLADARTAQGFGGIVLFRMILKTECEGAAQCADDIVVGFLRPARRVDDLDEHGVANRAKGQGTDCWTPHLLQDLAMSGERDGRENLALYARCFVRKEGVKDIGAATRPQRDVKVLAEPVGRECLSETERASGNLRSDLG